VFYYPQKDYFNDPNKLPIKPQEVSINSTENIKLVGWFFKHIDSDSKKPQKPKAKILFFHGNAQNISTHFNFLYFLLQYQIDYLIFDYRGYGLSEGEPTPKGTIEDGVAAINWILNQDPEVPLIVFAQSLGGVIATKSIIEFQKTQNADQLKKSLKLIVIDSSFSNYRVVAADTLSKHWLTWLFQPIAWLIVDNSQTPESELNQLSPTPILLLHGTSDKVVSFSMGKRYFEQSSEPKYFIPIHKGQHTDFLFKDGGRNRTPFVSLIDKSLKCSDCLKEGLGLIY
jgi:fermentation-respiration switch protein FrsA (DUF1100 family)